MSIKAKIRNPHKLVERRKDRKTGDYYIARKEGSSTTRDPNVHQYPMNYYRSITNVTCLHCNSTTNHTTDTCPWVNTSVAVAN